MPGSGFKQAEGTFHIRTTILVSDLALTPPFNHVLLSVPSKKKPFLTAFPHPFSFHLSVLQPAEDQFNDIVERFSSFHRGFMK